MPTNIKTFLGPIKPFGAGNFTGFKKEEKYKSNTFKVGIVTVNQIFGHEDVVNMRNYTTTVKCLSNEAALFVCKADEFYHKVNTDEKAW